MSQIACSIANFLYQFSSQSIFWSLIWIYDPSHNLLHPARSFFIRRIPELVDQYDLLYVSIKDDCRYCISSFEDETTNRFAHFSIKSQITKNSLLDFKKIIKNESLTLNFYFVHRLYPRSK